MKKYSLLAVFLLLMCNVSVCGQTGRILFVDTTFIEKTNLQRIHHSLMPPLLAVAYGMMRKSKNSRCGILPVAESY